MANPKAAWIRARILPYGMTRAPTVMILVCLSSDRMGLPPDMGGGKEMPDSVGLGSAILNYD